ncbi:unnamed protein product [Sphagnum compactum]
MQDIKAAGRKTTGHMIAGCRTVGRRTPIRLTQAEMAPLSSVAMAVLSGLRERQETTRRTSRCYLERSGASHNTAATLCCSTQRCGATRVAAAL